MKILAFDTANGNNDIAILKNDKVVASLSIKDSTSQAEMLVPGIEECLKEAKIWYGDLDLIATTKGPGNFTGVRIGFTVAKTIKLAANVPFIALDNVESLAYDYIDDYEGKILAVLDARLDEFFIQEFTINNKDLIAKYEDPKLISQLDINNYLPLKDFLIIGSGKEIAKELINTKTKFEISKKNDVIKAQNIARLALKIFETKGFNEEEILYVRKPAISKPKSS